MSRRAFLGLLGVAAAQSLAACVYRTHSVLPAAGGITPDVAGPTTSEVTPLLPPIESAKPGPARVVSQLDRTTNEIAITIDDGTCAACVSRYVEFAESSGIALSFSPNGIVRANWDPHAAALRQLIAAGRVQIINHTWSHFDLLKQSDAAIAKDVKQNESWIEDTFGVTARPWFRPPFGFRNSRTDDVVAQLGYTNVLMWNGSFGDSGAITPATLRHLADQYLQPGTIMLGHANVSTISGMYDEILAMIRERGLTPVLMSNATLPAKKSSSTTTPTTRRKITVNTDTTIGLHATPTTAGHPAVNAAP